MTLLEIFRNPGELAGISLLDQLLGALQITVIGMALTFVALILVWLAVRTLARFTARPQQREPRPIPIPRTPAPEDGGESVAAIAAVLALLAADAPERFRVKQIIRGPDGGTRWADWER